MGFSFSFRFSYKIRDDRAQPTTTNCPILTSGMNAHKCIWMLVCLQTTNSAMMVVVVMMVVLLNKLNSRSKTKQRQL